MVNRVGQHLTGRGRSLDRARVLLLGLAYKPGSSDLRESPSLEVAHLLAGHGAQVSAADPFVDPATAPAALDGVRLVLGSDEELAAADAVVLLTDHENFDYDRVAARSRLPGPFGGPPGRHRGAVVTGGLLVTDAGDVKR